LLFAYGKLTHESYFCSRFGQIDAELGWVLKPSAVTCVAGREPFSSSPSWFEGKVFTDANGFRSAKSGGDTPKGGVLFAGDSWTFGYGLSFEESFPGQFSARSGVGAAVAASPAYGSAQALLLAERWVERLTPRAIVYLDIGLWERSACRGATKPAFILKPCYWQSNGASSAELVTPPPGTVENAASWGITPGGMLGVGEDTWTYFLWSRPVAQLHHLLVRANLAAGFGHDFRAAGVDDAVVHKAVLDHLVRLAGRAHVPVLLLDPADTYKVPLAALGAEQSRHLHHVGKAVWRSAVDEPAAELPPEIARVPHDGHFGPGMNALVAALVQSQLQTLEVLK
jgi:hypothetical protein